MIVLYVYIGSVVLYLLSLIGATKGIRNELKVLYTKEQLKKYKSSGENPFTKYFIAVCPVVNIMISFIYMFYYDELKSKVIGKYRKQLDIPPVSNEI